jgi:hypothetical protein
MMLACSASTGAAETKTAIVAIIRIFITYSLFPLM